MRRGLRPELGLFPLAAVVFFNVSGGPYGIEDMVPSFGPGLTLTLLVLTPLLWSVPVVLAMSELASAIPDEGGYVTWVERAFGPFWGFQVGWWSWIDSFVDVAVYPVLFVEYVRYWYPGIGPLERWLLAVGFIVILTAVNVIGVRATGVTALILGAAALAPIVVLVASGVFGAHTWPGTPFLADHQTLGAGLGLGLAVVMWNYAGWDMPAMCLGETRAPGPTFRAAAWIVLPVITAAYVLPVTVGLASGTIPWSAWTTGALPMIARGVGGGWLGHAVAAGAVISSAGLFLALLLTNSRLPWVLARRGFLPESLGTIAPRFGTPWGAVILSAALYAAFAVFSFRVLVVLNIWLYSLSLLVELGAFVRLRVAEPELPRPWRVPGRAFGVAAVAGAPTMFALSAMATAGWRNTLAGVAAALTGPAAYMFLTRRRSSSGSRGQ